MLQTLFISWDIGPDLYQGIIELGIIAYCLGCRFLGHFLMKMMENEDCPENGWIRFLFILLLPPLLVPDLGMYFFMIGIIIQKLI